MKEEMGGVLKVDRGVRGIGKVVGVLKVDRGVRGIGKMRKMLKMDRGVRRYERRGGGHKGRIERK